MLFACEANYWSLMSFNAIAGRLFNAEEVTQRDRVCVIGQDLARQVFGGDQEAVGQTLTIDDNLYTVVGVLGGLRMGDRTLSVLVPLTTAQSRVVGLSNPLQRLRPLFHLGRRGPGGGGPARGDQGQPVRPGPAASSWPGSPCTRSSASTGGWSFSSTPRWRRP